MDKCACLPMKQHKSLVVGMWLLCGSWFKRVGEQKNYPGNCIAVLSEDKMSNGVKQMPG